MKIFRQLSLLAFAAFTCVSAFAYDAVGHRIIADIAYQNLTPAARRQVDLVLGTRGMIYEATWADEIRSDKAYSYSYQWHYQDLDDNMSDAQIKSLLKNPTAEGKHLFYALDSLTTLLKKDRNNAEALKFIVHLTGDLHQPLHMGRKDDKGGNTVEYNWFGKKANLHSVWDGSLIEYKKMSFSEYSSYLQYKYEPKRESYKKCGILESVIAAYQVRNAIYAYDYTEKSNYLYAYKFMDSLDDMLYRGGIQLATILNSIYK